MTQGNAIVQSPYSGMQYVEPSGNDLPRVIYGGHPIHQEIPWEVAPAIAYRHASWSHSAPLTPPSSGLNYDIVFALVGELVGRIQWLTQLDLDEIKMPSVITRRVKLRVVGSLSFPPLILSEEDL